MFIITKTFTDDEGHLFTKVNPKQYSTPGEAYDAMREDYLNELKSRGLEDNGSSNDDGKSVPITIPIERVIEAFWPYATKPSALSVSTELDADGISANFMLGQEAKDSYPGIWLTSKNSNTGRADFWFCLELPNETNDMVKGYLYAGDDETETDQPLAVIADGVRNEDDESKRVLWVDGSLTHVEPLTDNYLKRQGAATEKQLDEYDA